MRIGYCMKYQSRMKKKNQGNSSGWINHRRYCIKRNHAKNTSALTKHPLARGIVFLSQCAIVERRTSPFWVLLMVVCCFPFSFVQQTDLHRPVPWVKPYNIGGSYQIHGEVAWHRLWLPLLPKLSAKWLRSVPFGTTTWLINELGMEVMFEECHRLTNSKDDAN